MGTARNSDYERLRVYQQAKKFLAFAERCADSLPHHRRYISDQLRRAAFSIVLNIAEGAGEFSPPEKRRFYRMARRSASECSAILEALEEFRLVANSRVAEGKTIVRSVTAMLVAMCKGPTADSAKRRRPAEEP